MLYYSTYFGEYNWISILSNYNNVCEIVLTNLNRENIKLRCILWSPFAVIVCWVGFSEVITMIIGNLYLVT